MEFFDEKILDHIVLQSNLHAHQKDGYILNMDVLELKKIAWNVGSHGCGQWRIQKILVGGMIKILSTKPQKFGCVVNRRVVRKLQ